MPNATEEIISGAKRVLSGAVGIAKNELNESLDFAVVKMISYLVATLVIFLGLIWLSVAAYHYELRSLPPWSPH